MITHLQKDLRKYLGTLKSQIIKPNYKIALVLIDQNKNFLVEKSLLGQYKFIEFNSDFLTPTESIFVEASLLLNSKYNIFDFEYTDFTITQTTFGDNRFLFITLRENINHDFLVTISPKSLKTKRLSSTTNKFFKNLFHKI